jgi:hypothetical protein
VSGWRTRLTNLDVTKGRFGRELFFRPQNEYYAAPAQTAGPFEAGPPQCLFEHGLPVVSTEIASYDVAMVDIS